MSAFPATRLRRLRRSAPLRGARARDDALARRPRRSRSSSRREALPNERLPALARLTVEGTLRECEELLARRRQGGDPLRHPRAEGRARARGAYGEDGIVQQALRALRPRFPELLLLTDVCLCEYTSHGHCGVVRGEEVDNDASLELLARTAVSHVEAGADVVCPSDMMDGRVGGDPRGAARRRRSSPTRPSTPPRSTGPSARRPARRRPSATAAATRWIPPTCARRCASASSTSPRAPTRSWSSPRSPTST